ncbi:MAG: KpsF/GutQ family sugar-phosphate isomerase [Elusimicrobiaceae bacterium]|nr:KpsF/GutQ family sugar-phosphate isomerase [Elusimicrobiaceae bacterium]
MDITNKKDLDNAKDIVKREIICLQKLEELLVNTPLSKVLDLMQNTKGRVIFTGMGKSGIVAQKIVASLASTGTPAFFVHPAEASHGDLGMISKEDIVLAISNSGESKELVDIVNYCKRFGITMVGITKNPQSSLGKCVDYILQLPNVPEADTLGLAPTCSTTATLVLGDVLTVCLMNRNKFTETDFGIRHPGGKLGSILQSVAEIMHKGDEMPILPEDSTFEKIIITMSDKRLGCVGFVDKNGKLSGIFTDGDLRRKISPDLFNKTGKDLMHPKPQQIAPDMLCSAAIRLMNEKKITSLFIVKDYRPVGIVHIHDLLKKGVS